jgi:ribonucleotide reductase alpha subunit
MSTGTTSYYASAPRRPILDIKPADRFALSSDFVDKFRGNEPEWGPVGKFTFKRTYARPLANGGTEEFWQTIERIVNGIYTVQKWHCKHHNLPWSDSKAQRSAQTMYQLMWDFKFLPGGRGLWMMGTDYVEKHGSAALNNCFSAETRAWIDGCPMSLGEVAEATKSTEQKVSVLAGDGEWRPARVMSFGVQPVRRVEFAPAGLRSNFRLSYNVTANHRWVLADGSETTELKVGDLVLVEPVAPSGSDADAAIGFAHGLVFGDGTRHTYYPDRHIIRLCGKKDQAFLEHLERLPYHRSTVRHASANFDPIVTFVLPAEERSWKELPASYKSPAYQSAFLKGWLAADGTKKPSGSLCLNSQNAEAVAWAVERAPLLGYCVVGLNYDSVTETNYGPRSAPMARLTLTEEVTTYVAKSIVDEGREEEVYCVVEPKTGRFTLEGGLVTGNCAFVSTEYINVSFSEPFCFLMDFSMLGVGVGSDCRGAGKVTVQAPVRSDEIHVVEDTREGWVDLLHRHLQAYVGKATLPASIDYSKVRPYGSAINGFGGTASGPDPLVMLIKEVQRILNPLVGRPITSEAIVDICDLIGVCVVAGNVRRTAIIMFGEGNDDSFLNLKNPAVNSEAMKSHRWASNNSVLADVGMSYRKTSAISAKAGEPGYMWLDNARKYGRMGEPADDSRVQGFNPCAEISLESYELCNLVELFPSRHASYEEFERTIKFAYLYAKTVSLIPTHNSRTNAVMLRNRRIGLSQSGIVQSFKRHGRREHLSWCDRGYNYVRKLDRMYSEWLCVRQSIKKTTVKPAGTTSLLPGVTPGIHYEHDEYYFRTVRVAQHNPLVEEYRKAGYRVEMDVYDKQGRTCVIYFPIKAQFFDRGKSDVSIWEQMENAAQMQKHWSDNSVSVTVSFKPEEGKDIERVLELYETRLKTVSFLPLEDHGYEQAPYITIDRETYEAASAKLSQASFNGIGHDIADTPKFCDTDTCAVPKRSTKVTAVLP